jgi:hypothetical protein
MPATSKPVKEVQTYCETYRKGALDLTGQTPMLRHVRPGVKVVEAYIEKAGTVLRGEQELEFQVIRVYLER